MLAMAALTMAAIGCQNKPATTVALPVHQLDWSTPVNSASPNGNSSSHNLSSTNTGDLAAGEADWANVTGYRQWRYIVVHHSASPTGSAAEFDVEHRDRGWDGLGYHFVIDNGHGGPDGRVEVGERWRVQKWGAHTGKTPGNEYNYHGIGICLVGDFTHHMPTANQLASLRRLVSYLMAKYEIPAQNVVGHCDGPGTSTECPGRMFHAYLHSTFRAEISR
jgi:N-acetyl-anhydromuramyl-L-alanine amidase AmpD